ncbi:MAG: hypothetical protein LBN92_07630 [Treponema sp.]|nr:hypothetical protein [Treponema sp.]
MSNIGTRNEKSLHRALKLRYAASDEAVEVAKAGYICDAVGKDGEMIEIQTGSFGPLKKKLAALTKLGKVKLVYPVALSTMVELYDAGGILQSKKQSPRRGTIWDIFRSFLHAPTLMLLPRLSIEIALVRITEKRVDDGTGSWFRGGIRIDDRVFEAWEGALTLARASDYRRFIPYGRGEIFTVRDLAKKVRIRETLAKKTLWVLTKAGFTEAEGKRGRAITYRLCGSLPKKRSG